jgi:hypothetical protein
MSMGDRKKGMKKAEDIELECSRTAFTKMKFFNMK